MAADLLVARLALGLLAVGAAPWLPATSRADRDLFTWLVAGVAMPVACLIHALHRHGSPAAGRVAGAIADAAVLFVFALAFPAASVAVAVAWLPLVAFYGFVGGRSAGLPMAAAGFGLTAIAETVHRGSPLPNPFDPFSLALFGGALAAMVLLVDRATILRTGSAREVAELRDKADAILARVADGVAVTSATGRVHQWNHAAEQLFGSNAAAAVHKHCNEVLGLHVGTRPADCRKGCALLAMGESADPATGVEVWREAPDGRRQPLLANVSPIVDPDGEVVEIVHSLRDVTRLKQAEEAKTLFLATASHELKTPLTVIQGFTQTMLLNPGLDDETRRRALGAIERRSLQLGKIVDRLLLSSRIEAGRVDLDLRPVDIRAIVAERAGALGESTGRPVELDIPDVLPPVRADPDAVATVVDHLLDNAVKYSPADAPVRLRARAVATGVDVEVADDGIGMNEDQTARCFDKFWQGEASDDRRYGGTGIGLYVVRSLVEAMEGSVRAESSPGRGAAFTVSLAAACAGHDAGEASVIREIMRQLGPVRSAP